jgi:hypothetical protein
VVVDRDPQFLFATEVLFGRLHADVFEKELDLLQFASRNMAKTRMLQVVRGKVAELWSSYELPERSAKIEPLLQR